MRVALGGLLLGGWSPERPAINRSFRLSSTSPILQREERAENWVNSWSYLSDKASIKTQIVSGLRELQVDEHTYIPGGSLHPNSTGTAALSFQTLQTCPMRLFMELFISILYHIIYSIQLNLSVLWPHGLQHTRFPCSSPTPSAFSNSYHVLAKPYQPSHPLSSLPPGFNLSHLQGLF